MNILVRFANFELIRVPAERSGGEPAICSPLSNLLAESSLAKLQCEYFPLTHQGHKTFDIISRREVEIIRCCNQSLFTVTLSFAFFHLHVSKAHEPCHVFTPTPVHVLERLRVHVLVEQYVRED